MNDVQPFDLVCGRNNLGGEIVGQYTGSGPGGANVHANGRDHVVELDTLEVIERAPAQVCYLCDQRGAGWQDALGQWVHAKCVNDLNPGGWVKTR